MKKAILLTAVFAMLAMSAQAGTRKIGNTYYHDNGTSSRQIGKTTYHSNGTNSRQIGNTTYHSDGSNSKRIGNTVYGEKSVYGY